MRNNEFFLNIIFLTFNLHRDDIVFFIFLYQRWIYKVDKKRVNEFGFSGEMLEDKNKTSDTDNMITDGAAIAEKSATDKKEE